MATTRPTGSANAAAMAVMSRVPVTSGQMPKCFSAPRSGDQVVPVKNSHAETSGMARNWPVCARRIARIVKVDTIESSAHPRSAPRITRSVPSRAARDRAVPRRLAAAAERAAVETAAAFCIGPAAMLFGGAHL